MKYKTVIFDLDGTLLSTLEDLKDSVNYALAEFGFETNSLEEMRKLVGNGIVQVFDRSMPQGTQNDKFNQVLAAFKKHYGVNCNNKTAPYKGIMELLGQLKEDGIKMAIVSNKYDAAVKDLNRQYFQEYIPVAIGECAEVKRKPAPDTVLQALRELGSTREETVYVGDSEVDIETANNTGIDCITVTWGFRDIDYLLSHGAEKLAHTPEEILKYLK